MTFASSAPLSTRCGVPFVGVPGWTFTSLLCAHVGRVGRRSVATCSGMGQAAPATPLKGSGLGRLEPSSEIAAGWGFPCGRLSRPRSELWSLQSSTTTGRRCPATSRRTACDWPTTAMCTWSTKPWTRSLPLPRGTRRWSSCEGACATSRVVARTPWIPLAACWNWTPGHWARKGVPKSSAASPAARWSMAARWMWRV
jgi:hypothetical protein